MITKFDSRIVIAGAGSIGCYLGGCLAAAGRNIRLLLREPLAEALSADGLRISDLGGDDKIIPPTSFELATDAAEAFDDADVVLVTVKCRHTREIAELIAAHAPQRLVVLSLQNGVGNDDALREIVEPRHVVAGMIPFNVVQTREGGKAPRFHRASSGTIQIGHGVEGLRGLLDVPGVPVAEHADIEALLWSKLLVNLNNALNALSDLPLAQELGDRRWRLLLRQQMHEGLAALRASGIHPARIEGVSPRLIAFALRLRDPFFGLVAGRMLAVDPLARSSMWEDLEVRRPTEIDYIQGEIVRVAENHGVPVPLNRRVMDCVKTAEAEAQGSPRLTPAVIKAGL
jgi:2-dehydropantoate 2-reductase